MDPQSDDIAGIRFDGILNPSSWYRIKLFEQGIGVGLEGACHWQQESHGWQQSGGPHFAQCKGGSLEEARGTEAKKATVAFIMYYDELAPLP